MPIIRASRAATVGIAVLASLAVGLPAASASGGGVRVQSQGACSQASAWKLNAKPDNGRIELGFEVDSNVVGQNWQVKITDNGVTVFQGSKVTVAPSGSFSVSRRVPNRAGADAFVARARNNATGESCTGRVTL